MYYTKVFSHVADLCNCLRDHSFLLPDYCRGRFQSQLEQLRPHFFDHHLPVSCLRTAILVHHNISLTLWTCGDDFYRRQVGTA